LLILDSAGKSRGFTPCHVVLLIHSSCSAVIVPFFLKLG
jgi:hypothetical protein